MRTIVELLVILRTSVRKERRPGMCGLINRLSHYGVITYPEDCKLTNYLDEHKPLWAKIRNILPITFSSYWWARYRKFPRIFWLTRRIWVEKIKLRLAH